MKKKQPVYQVLNAGDDIQKYVSEENESEKYKYSFTVAVVVVE